MRITAIPYFARHLQVALTLLLWCALPAQADQIHFSNGESISGVLVGIDQGRVTWRSSILGELSAELRHVERIESGDHFDMKLTGKAYNNCWMFVQRGKQLLHCDEGVRPLADWTLVVSAGETAIIEPPSVKRRGDIILALEDASGNTDITKYDINARTEMRYLDTRHSITARYVDESANEETTRESWFGGYQYDQFFTEQWFATGNTFYEKDEFRGVDHRASVGAGMGYQFLETAYFDLLGKGSINYVDEDFSTGRSRSSPGFLWNLDFAWRIDGQGMELFHRHAVLQSFAKREDYEFNSATGFKYPINGHFSSIVQLEYNYDALPAEETLDKVDRKWTVGVNYAF